MNQKTSTNGKKKSGAMARFGTYGIGAVIVIIGFVVTFQFVEPSPSSNITIAAGSSNGAYYKYAQQYKEILSRQGIKVNVLETKGSVDNLSRLTEDKSKVDIVFSQGGINPKKEQSKDKAILSLGSMYYEPLWVLYRADLSFERLTALAGKKIGIGQAGSGTQALSKVLLDRNGITGSRATLMPLSSKEAAQKLLAQEIDVMFMVASPNAPLLKKLLSSKQIKIMNFKRAEAYTRVFSYLSVISLPQGAISLDANLPSEDITLLATTANLVARKDLHPALINLILQAGIKVHDKHGLFAHAGNFPTPKYVSLPLNKEAKRFYKKGPPFLQRYFPFWFANMIDRLKIMLLPLVGLLLPLFKVAPPLYRWRVRRKIYRWYSELQEVDPEKLTIEKEDVNKHLSKLNSIEEEVTRLSVPLSYSDEVYNLRLHIGMVRKALQDHGQVSV